MHNKSTSLMITYFRAISRSSLFKSAAVSAKNGEKSPRKRRETCYDKGKKKADGGRKDSIKAAGNLTTNPQRNIFR